VTSAASAPPAAANGDPVSFGSVILFRRPLKPAKLKATIYAALTVISLLVTEHWQLSL
jgi:hypothetical protein